MVEKNLTVQRIEKRTSKNTGKDFWSAETSEGKMSIFDAEIASKIEAMALPATLNVDMREKGDFKNIVGLYLVEGATPAPAPQTPPTPAVKRDRVLCWENMPLKTIVEELNKLDTMASQLYPKGENYDCVAWLR